MLLGTGHGWFWPCVAKGLYLTWTEVNKGWISVLFRNDNFSSTSKTFRHICIEISQTRLRYSVSQEHALRPSLRWEHQLFRRWIWQRVCSRPSLRINIPVVAYWELQKQSSQPLSTSCTYRGWSPATEDLLDAKHTALYWPPSKTSGL